MNNPLISIIIPIYNVAFYLRECLDSVLAQSYTNLDIILVDDGSTDGSLDIALEYLNKDARIFLISKENGGQSSARNTGLEFLKGSALRSFFQDKKEENIISFCTTHG
ncbi:glycosyltransferase family 2 protein, partial [Campylobacter sp. VicNov18]